MNRCGPSPGTCAHARGPRRRFQVPEAKREGRTSVLRTHVHRLRETRRRAFQSEKPYPPSSDAAVLSSSRTHMVTSLLRARYVMSGTLMLIAASSQPPRTHHSFPTPVLLTPLTREVVAGGCCRFFRLHFLRKHKASDPLPPPPKVPHDPRPRSQPELSSCTRHGQARSCRVPCTTKWCPPGLGLAAELQAAEQCAPQTEAGVGARPR